jgi:hypothetical protein
MEINLLSCSSTCEAQAGATNLTIYNACVTTAVQSVAISATPPTTGQVLTATSATASQWATPSGGGSSYSLFYGLAPSDYAATIGVGTAVPFPSLGPTSGAATQLTSTTFNLPLIGDYEVSWVICIAEAGQLGITLNSSIISYSVVGRATGTNALNGNCIINNPAVNGVLSIVNPAGNSTALTVVPTSGGTSAVGVVLTIKKL